jgi:fido (protein-threonine AMPylation protein)
VSRNYELTHRTIPTVVAKNSSGDILIGDEARRLLVLGGRTNIWGFKQDLGKPPTQAREKKEYWTSGRGTGASDDVNTYSAFEAAELYLQKLLGSISRPAQLIVGIPSSAEETWVDHYKHNVTAILTGLGFESPRWLYEPFAVYQYYRAKYDVQFDEQQTILIVDIGGSTFSTCVVHTAKSGAIAKAGAHSVPIGLNSSPTGGNDVDRRFLECLSKKTKLSWKEAIENRVKLKQCAGVLPRVEEVKISLSKAFRKARLPDSVGGAEERVVFDAGSLHPDEAFSVSATTDDLQKVLDELWVNEWGPQVLSTLKAAQKALEMSSIVLDKAIVAGGSAQLPMTIEQLARVLNPYLDGRRSIIMLDDPGYAVAEGIAIEAREESKRYSNLKSRTLGPCLMGDLYLGVKRDRLGEFSPVSVSRGNRSDSTGRLFSRPLEMDSSELIFDFQFPFDINGKFYIGFFDKPIGEGVRPLNLANQPVSHHGGEAKLNRSARLQLNVSEDKYFSPTLFLKQKNKASKAIELRLDDFRHNSLELAEGEVFFGLDFGNSNSYITRILEANEAAATGDVPVYKQSLAAERSCKRLAKKINELSKCAERLNERFLAHAVDIIPDTVFHSSKLERLDVVVAEDGDKGHSAGEFEGSHGNEARALFDAYQWALSDIEMFDESPEGFLCKVHSLLFPGEHHSGKYRDKNKKPSHSSYNYMAPVLIEPRLKALLGTVKDNAESCDPLFLVAWTHAEFESIHPFEDGNGRVGRLLASVTLLRHGYPPLLLRADARDRYLDALERSNAHDVSQLVHIFSDALSNILDNLSSESEKPLVAQPGVRGISDDAVQALRSSDPLGAILEIFNASSSAEMRGLYEKVSAYLGEFYAAVCRSASKVNDKGLPLRLNPSILGDLSFESFRDACQDGKSISLWWFKIEMRSVKSYSSIIFEFVSGGAAESLGLVVVIKRLIEGAYLEIADEPISICKIAFSSRADPQIIGNRVEAESGEDGPDSIVERFLAECLVLTFPDRFRNPAHQRISSHGALM